ncbi:MAG: hypothetical protein M0T83_09170 [Nitrospiraceae bacterium]|nr:hypothetical protein [Nitrospiraceae bacterium]
MNSQEINNDAQQQLSGGLTLGEMWNILLRYKLFILTFPIIAILISSFALFIKKPEKQIWRAEGILKLGTFTDQKTSWNVESVSTLLTQFRETSIDSPEKNDWTLYRGSLSVISLPMNLVRIRVEGSSPEEAKDFVELIVNRLKEIQKEAFSGDLKYYKIQSEEIQNQIQRLKEVRKQLLQFHKTSLPGHNMMAVVSFMELLGNIDDDLFKLKIKLRNYEKKITSFEDKLLFVSVKKIPPRFVPSTKKQIIEASGFLGLLLGVLMAFIMNSFRKRDDDLVSVVQRTPERPNFGQK